LSLIIFPGWRRCADSLSGHAWHLPLPAWRLCEAQPFLDARQPTGV